MPEGVRSDGQPSPFAANSFVPYGFARSSRSKRSRRFERLELFERFEPQLTRGLPIGPAVGRLGVRL
jgi:hypothetical protein